MDMKKGTALAKTGLNGCKFHGFEITKLKIKDAHGKLARSRSDESAYSYNQIDSQKPEDTGRKKRS